MQLVVDIPDKVYNSIGPFLNGEKINGGFNLFMVLEMIKNGKPLPKDHGRLVDLSKIEDDRMESDNPVISLTVGGEYIEAVSLDYLNDLQTIIEADKEDT